MKNSRPLLILVPLLFIAQISFGQDAISKTVLKELEEAETIMFDKMPKFDPEYWKNSVHKDYITINADGIMLTKEEALADSSTRKVKNAATVKYKDTIRISTSDQYDSAG